MPLKEIILNKLIISGRQRGERDKKRKGKEERKEGGEKERERMLQEKGRKKELLPICGQQDSVYGIPSCLASSQLHKPVPCSASL